MSWAERRKIIYLSILCGIIFVIIGIPFLLSSLNKPSMCSINGNSMGKEIEGTTCGGICTNLCRSLELHPVVLWERAFQVTPGVYTAVAYIENPNVGAIVPHIPYSFEFYDSNNSPIVGRTGTTNIPPGTNFVILESGIHASTTPSRVTFQFTGNYDWYRNTVKTPLLIIRNRLASNVDVSPRVDADIVNNTFVDIDHVDVTVIMYDIDGNAFAASKTIVSNLLRQSIKHIVFTWPQPFKQKIAGIETLYTIKILSNT